MVNKVIVKLKRGWLRSPRVVLIREYSYRQPDRFGFSDTFIDQEKLSFNKPLGLEFYRAAVKQESSEWGLKVGGNGVLKPFFFFDDFSEGLAELIEFVAEFNKRNA